jgi:merozoite surface antigen 2 (fragment)
MKEMGMSKFFHEETKRRILVCVTAATIATSSLVAGVTPVFAETSSNTAATTLTSVASIPTETSFTFTQGNIPPVRQDVPDDEMAVQFISDATLQGYKFVGDFEGHLYAPSGLTDPDGHAILKWVADDGTVMQPGELAELQYINGLTFHAVWQTENPATPATPANPSTPATPSTPADPSTSADSETQSQNAQEQSNSATQEQTPSGRRSKKSVLPETGDAASVTGLLASAGSILAAAGFMRRRKH